MEEGRRKEEGRKESLPPPPKKKVTAGDESVGGVFMGRDCDSQCFLTIYVCVICHWVKWKAEITKDKRCRSAMVVFPCAIPIARSFTRFC